MASPIVFTKVRATPHQIVYTFIAGSDTDVTYATLLADAVDGPLKNALVAAAGLTDTNDKAIACLITGAFPLSALSSGFSDIQTTTCAVAPASFTGVTAAVDAGNSPKLTVAGQSDGTLYVTHRWSPTV